MKTLSTKSYLEQLSEWPKSGQHIMAHYDDETIVVYQAYRHEIGNYASRHNYFGGDFCYNRMSWIKPNFLWMMYRSGWGTKEGQEIILAITLKRSFFDEILSKAISSTYQISEYASREEWQAAVAHSDVRLQWDPDHAPDGSCVARRAIQLGLRGKMLSRYGRDEILQIEDISKFVAEQRVNMQVNKPLTTPLEQPYRPQLGTENEQNKFQH
ncbi:hypothetical protein NT6N_18710 [Oceaniferula spumae]|uniref:DUF4291 domain-containing protein n=1 Tax=Oceaniferula spumae TaxID=2979115 RepID=A0AAT9FLH4_9BACT